MKLFTIGHNGEVTPTEECLLIEPFAEIWQRDSHIKKDLASRELTYIEFMVSPKDTNVFYGYDLESGTRSQKIIDNKFKEYPDWYPDDVVEEGIDQYKEFLSKASSSLSYYEANLCAAAKVRQFFLTFDMEERNMRTGAPIYSAKSITDGIKNADDVLTKLDTMKKKVEQELYETSKTKGNKKINPFER